MTIRLLLECPPVVWILRWYKLVINVEEHNTEFQIAANFKHKPCGNTRVIFSGDLQCLRLEETIIKTKTKNWDNLIFKTCILHSLELSNTSFFQNKKLIDFQNLHPPFIRFQVESLHRVEHLGISNQKLFNSSPLCKSFFDYLQFWRQKNIPPPPHLSIHSGPQWPTNSEKNTSNSKQKQNNKNNKYYFPRPTSPSISPPMTARKRVSTAAAQNLTRTLMRTSVMVMVSMLGLRRVIMRRMGRGRVSKAAAKNQALTVFFTNGKSQRSSLISQSKWQIGEKSDDLTSGMSFAASQLSCSVSHLWNIFTLSIFVSLSLDKCLFVVCLPFDIFLYLSFHIFLSLFVYW